MAILTLVRKYLFPILIFVLPLAMFALLVSAAWTASFQATLPDTLTFKDNWLLFGTMGNAFSGIGTLFVALAVGVSLVTYFSQLKQAEETRKQLLEAATIQAKTVEQLQKQAQAATLAARIQSLTSRLQGYEEQIGMIRGRNANSMSAERKTEDDANVQRMRMEQNKLYQQLDRILDDLRIGTKAEIPREGTYSDPF